MEDKAWWIGKKEIESDCPNAENEYVEVSLFLGDRPTGKLMCRDSNMTLYVGYYCDPVKCAKVRSGEIKAI